MARDSRQSRRPRAPDQESHDWPFSAMQIPRNPAEAQKIPASRHSKSSCHLTTPRRWWEGQLLEWADAAGLAAYAVLGTAKALAWGVTPVPAMMMGVITGCIGGVIRDVVAGRPSIIMRPEIYVTAAALTSALVVAGHELALPGPLVWPVAALAGFTLRGLAIARGLALPSYKRDEG